MGNLSEQPNWRRPITRQTQARLRLNDGTLVSDLAGKLQGEFDHYELAPFVCDEGWLSQLSPCLPRSLGRGQCLIRASHATLTCEFEDWNLIVDPGQGVATTNHRPSVIAVTHAHADHAGGLLDLAEENPEASVICTTGTFELLQLLPNGHLYRKLFEDRGHLMEADGQPRRIEGVDYRYYPAGHLYGAAMLDVDTSQFRMLISGDYSLREIGGLAGGVWPMADYDLLIMESSHGWDKDFPTVYPEQNWASLVSACLKACDDGYERLVIAATALGEAQDVYYALCRAQMKGLFPDFMLRLASKAAVVAQYYQKSTLSRFDPWTNTPHKITSLAHIPPYSIVIGTDPAVLTDANSNQTDIAVVTPQIGALHESSGYRFNVSLHASFSELFATAMAVKCQTVALYHGQTGDSARHSPLSTLLERTGRHVVYLAEHPQLFGGLS